jgi:hypothetical protein
VSSVPSQQTFILVILFAFFTKPIQGRSSAAGVAVPSMSMLVGVPVPVPQLPDYFVHVVSVMVVAVGAVFPLGPRIFSITYVPVQMTVPGVKMTSFGYDIEAVAVLTRSLLLGFVWWNV